MGSRRGVCGYFGKVKPRADEGVGCSPMPCAGRGFVTGSKGEHFYAEQKALKMIY